MQVNKNQVVEINLKDLFFHLLYRWRSILLAALIGAIVLGAYQHFSVQKTHSEGKLTKDERAYQLDIQNYQENLEGSRTKITVLSKALAGQRAYQAESVYIRLDAQNVWTATGKYLVKVDQSVLDALPAGSTIDPADSILPAYAAPLAGEIDDQELMEAFNTEKAEYIGELVKVTTDPLDNSVMVEVKSGTKEGAEKGIAFISKRMQMLVAGQAQEIYPHQLIVLSETVTLGADDDLVLKQAELRKAMDDNQKELQDARRTLDELEASGEPSAPGTRVKRMIVIGFLLGAFLLACVYILRYVTNGRLKTHHDLDRRFSLPILGELGFSGSKHHGKGLDKWIDKWYCRNRIPDEKTVFDSIAALINEQKDADSLLLTSTLSEEKLNGIGEELVSRLEGKTLKMQAGFLSNSAAIQDAGTADTVILYEEKNVSRMQEIDRMAESLMIGKANVLGAILR